MEPLVPDDVQFLRVGGRTYTITEVALPTVDALVANINATQERRASAAVAALRSEFVQEAFRLENNEMDRLVRTAQSNSVTVPNERACMPLVVIQGEVCPVRSCLYSPCRFTGSVRSFQNYASPVFEKVNTSLGYEVLQQARGAEASHQLIIEGHHPDADIVLYTLCQEKLLCTREHMHTTGTRARSSDGTIRWYDCCTGDTPATRYWQLARSEFNKAINSVNLDSMARRGVLLSGVTKHISELMLEMTDWHVTHVKPDTEWRAE